MAGGGTGQWQLSVRVDRPVEGCEIVPHVHFYQKGEKGVGTSNNPKFTFAYRWLRGPGRPVCANEQCPRAQSFSPLQWSKFSRKGVSFSIQCVACARLRAPRHQSVFCTLQCFRDAWKQHKTLHTSLAQRGQKPPPPPPPPQQSDGEGEGGPAEPVSEVEEATPPPPPVDYLTAETGDQDWIEVSTERSYVPQEVDIGRCLKLEVRVQVSPSDQALYAILGGSNQPFRTADTEPVLAAPPLPPKRMLATVKAALAPNGFKFRVATYNVLAEIYATQQMYPYCDPWALNWTYRKANLMREIREVQADVLFLQEVQADHYDQHVQPELSELGYDGLYKHKTREAMGASGKVDGCAVFWRRSKFRLAEKYLVEFNDCARRQAADLGLSHEHQQVFLQRLLKDNVAQAAVLEVLGRQRGRGGGGNLICLANTHLYSHPEFPDVKLWQCYQLLRWLEDIVLPSQMPLILCGDFNSEPTSAVYELVSQRAVPPDHVDMVQDPCDVIRSLYLLSEGPHGQGGHQISHNLQLKSAYYMVQGEEPRFTNYTVGYEGVLDYIWFTAAHLRPVAVAVVPDEQELQQTGEALPSVQHSSDHIMLYADLQLGPVAGAGGGGLGAGARGVVESVRKALPSLGGFLGGGGGGRA